MRKERDRERGMVGIWVVLACIWVWNPSTANSATNPADVSALNALYGSLNSPGQLKRWTSNGGDPCGQSWLGVTCSGSAVTKIKLPGLELSGKLGNQISSLTSLTELDLRNNNLGGGQQIPYHLPPNLERLNLAGNQFIGNIPYSISQIVSLRYLNLGHNQLQGSLGDMFRRLTNLTKMDLSFNALTGDLPQSFGSLSRLTTLYLQNNQFTGSINVLASLPLNDLNVANNLFTGWIPDKLKRIKNIQTVGNAWSSGPAPVPPPSTPTPSTPAPPPPPPSTPSPPPPPPPSTPHPPPSSTPPPLPPPSTPSPPPPPPPSTPPPLPPPSTPSPPPPPPSPSTPPPLPPPSPPSPPPSAPSPLEGRQSNPSQQSGGNNDPSGGDGKNFGIGAGGIAGIIISIFAIAGIIACFLRRKRMRKSSRVETLEQDQPFSLLDPNHIKEMKPIQIYSAVKTAAMPSSTPIGVKPPPIVRFKSFDEDDFSNKPLVKKANAEPIKATVYSVADLQLATNGFSIDNLIDEGSCGRVYKAKFSDGKVLAVKIINSSALPIQSAEDFIEVISHISQLHHPNLTELVGYCSEHGQYLLVYEYYKNGSLHDLLHLSDEYSEPLAWNTRVNIALGTARALEYLHEVCSPSVVHKNFKSSNILLDMEFNPHLSDCGLTDLIPDAEFLASDQNIGSGYDAPEVALSGQYTLKSDVYSFGVVMLELLTGRKPFDSSRPRSEKSLILWATSQLHDIDALDSMVDPALRGIYHPKSLSRFADVIALCVQPEPEFRPPMSEVVEALVHLVQRANMSQRLLGGDAQEIA